MTEIIVQPVDEPLSKREMTVERLVVRHAMKNIDIAKLLGITEKGVKFHLTNIYRKQNVKTRSQLIAKMGPKYERTEGNKSDSEKTGLGSGTTLQSTI